MAYQDGSIGVTDDALTMTGYYFPGTVKRVPLAAVRSVHRTDMGARRGKGRIWEPPTPAIGPTSTRGAHARQFAFLVDAGKAVKPFLTADDPAAFEAALRERGVEITDSGSAPVVSPHISNHPRRLWAPLLPGRPRPGRPPRRQSRTPSR